MWSVSVFVWMRARLYECNHKTERIIVEDEELWRLLDKNREQERKKKKIGKSVEVMLIGIIISWEFVINFWLCTVYVLYIPCVISETMSL